MVIAVSVSGLRRKILCFLLFPLRGEERGGGPPLTDTDVGVRLGRKICRFLMSVVVEAMLVMTTDIQALAKPVPRIARTGGPLDGRLGWKISRMARDGGGRLKIS